MAREDEIRGRRNDFVAEAFEVGHQLFAGGDDGAAGLLEPGAILESGDGAGLRQTVERIGVEAVLDAFQRLDQLRVAGGESDAQAGQRTRLGKRLHYQQVRVAID